MIYIIGEKRKTENMSGSNSEPTIDLNMSLQSPAKEYKLDFSENERSDRKVEMFSESVPVPIRDAGDHDSNSNAPRGITPSARQNQISNTYSAMSFSVSKTCHNLFLKEIAGMSRDLAMERDELTAISVKNAILMDELTMVGTEL